MKLIGTKDFYRSLFKIAIPIMVQNAITNMVGLVNNITVGSLGTEQLAGVAIANQLIGIFYLFIFGAVSAAGIFGVQFEGKQDYEGVRHIFRLKLYLVLGFSVLSILLFVFFGRPLIGSFLHDSSDGTDLTLTLNEGYKYLLIMLIGFIPYGVSSSYSSGLREAGVTAAPMRASSIALVLSVGLNFLLIPIMGVAGAATATVVSRFAECAINIFWSHKHPERIPFIIGVYKSLSVPGDLVKKVLIKGAPLIFNETVWQIGLTVISQSYSYHGVNAVAAVNMATTIVNVVNVLFMSMGVTIGIIMGNMLGAGKLEEAKDTNVKLIATSVFISLGVGAVLLLLGPLFPKLSSNTAEEVKELAKWLIWCEALGAPFRAFGNACYYTIRSGGKTLLTALYDCGFVWYASVPTAYFLTHFTDLGIIPIYFAVKMVEGIKCIVGFIMVKRGKWVTNIVNK